MAASLAEKTIAGTIYRIGRKPDPMAWPDWQYVDEDGNRWDDPSRIYRVLYAGDSILGCFLEVLARFRPNPKLIEELDAIVDNDEGLPKTETSGTLHQKEWLDARLLAEIPDTRGSFADVGHSESLAYLDRALKVLVQEHQLEELDGSAIRKKAPRALTQAISAHIYESYTADGRPFGGIFYLSRWGDDLSNYALFEGGGRWEIHEVLPHALSEHLHSFNKAIAMHGIALLD